jgi:hypothetical protein
MFLLALTLSMDPMIAPVAYAADDEGGDLDETDAPKKKSGGKKKKGTATTKVREITRGTYAKSNVGGAFYVGKFAGAVSAGSYVGASFGKDFVDHEKSSMAWEIGVGQGLHNGADYLTQASAGCMIAGGAAPCTQGDLRTYAFTAAYEYSMYPTRRVGIGLRAGTGALFSPVLMDPTKWAEIVVDEYGGVDPGYHNAVHPLVFGGPTIEYYTKLSHFSVGADVDVVYGIGWDLGVNASGTLKYTF